MFRATNNCSMLGPLKASVEFDCSASIKYCEGLSGFCDCDGDGEKDDGEEGFDCPNPEDDVTYFSCWPKYCKPPSLLTTAQEEISKPVHKHSAAGSSSA